MKKSNNKSKKSLDKLSKIWDQKFRAINLINFNYFYDYVKIEQFL